MDSRTPPRLPKQPSFYADTSPSPRTESSGPATPLSSGRHKGPHRDGFSVEKCRDVLVRHCSWIPRNYKFRDGVNQVYEVLREYLGDENLDLATAQLNELIEVPSQWPHDEGASFQSWKHDYMLRHKDLENSHVPRLRNIIVAPVNPTERLKRWREDHPERERPAITSSRSSQTISGNGQIRPITPDYGIGTRANWRLENALFVSSRTKGTQVLHCPSAQELHNKTWNEDFGRGGKLVQERVVNPGEPVDEIDHMPAQSIPLKGKKSFADLRVLFHVPIFHRILSINFVPEKLDASLHLNLSTRSKGRSSKQASTRDEKQVRTYHHLPDTLLGRFASEVKTYEDDPTVRDLPDPESDTGKPYYSHILTWPLPSGICVPSPRFARKHNLVPEEIPLPGRVLIKLVPTADEVAIEKSFRGVIGAETPNHATGFAGPFTPELFKDSGIDFPQNWGVTQKMPAGDAFEAEALSDMGNLGDAAQSPPKHQQSLRHDIEGSSSFSEITESKENELANVSYSPSCNPVQILSKNYQDFVPKVKQFNQRQWFNFTERFPQRTPQRTASSPIPAVESLGETPLVLTHSLTDLTKAIQKFSSKSFQPREMASPVSGLLSKEGHSPDILYSFGPYRLERPEIKPAMKSAIKGPTNSIQVSTITMNKGCKATADEIETDEKSESLPLTEIPEITLNPPADDCKDFSTQACVQVKAENRPVLVAEEIIFFSSTVMEKNVSERSTLELALDLLQGTGYVRSETMLNCGFLGAKRHVCVQKYQNNNNKTTEALSKCEHNEPKTFTTASPKDTSKISFTLIHNNKELSKEWISRQKPSVMDLNRDLPPLPATNKPQPLQFEDQSHQHSLESEANYTVEPLQPLFYDPVRDSLRYGGLHFHSDGMRHSPEILQYPPRTSSMPRTCKALETASGTKIHQVTTREYQGKSPVANLLAEDVFRTASVSKASYGSEGSSGIMGNFIPVKTVTKPSVTVTRAVHLPRIETDCSKQPTSQNPKHNATNENASPQVLTCFEKDPEHIDSSKSRISNTIETQQGSESSIASLGDHVSIDLSDPEALAKYIKHLKKIKKQNFVIQEQPLGPGSSLSQNLDSEAGKCIENRYMNNRAIIDSDKEAEDIQLAAQDYSDIRAGNPFEFDHDDALGDRNRTTTFTHFMGGTNRVHERSNIKPNESKKMGHLKNSRSESNVYYPKKRPEPIQVVEQNTSRHILQRSDSSPGLPPTRIAAGYGVTPNSLQFLDEEDGRSNCKTINRSGYLNDLPRSPIAGHSFQISSPRRLDDVQENQETNSDTPPQSQKRPWSPVKMIFGEGGLLSINTNSKYGPNTPKKPGLVEKIKLKIEEIGLKADLNPIKYPFRSDQEKSPEHSTFPISLNPAQQAELYLDIELLICDSANTFLMNEYHNGRMSVDSLKKVTDFWKSKGRPQVVEFHYDQSTQRDLIVANQKTFRFYGPNANNPLKVHAMLYAWKTNAREMGIRTFCYPDSMIRKHIQDAFVILDFIGGHPFHYIAAHEVHKKLLRWISEGPVQVTAGIPGPPNLQRVEPRPDESQTELVIDSPWYGVRKPVQHLNKQSSISGNAQHTT